MRVHAGDTIKVEDIGTLGTVKKTDGKGNVLAEFQFPEGAVEVVIPVMIIAHVVKGAAMYRLEFEQAVGHPVSDEEYRKAELVLMNTKAIIGTQQIAYIYEIWGTEAIDILYSLVEERGKLIESLGEARKENSDLWKENRTLREFRDTIIREAQRKEPKLLPLEGNQ